MHRSAVQTAVDDHFAPRLAEGGWKRRGSRGFVRRRGTTCWVIKLVHREYRQEHGACRITAKVMRLHFAPFTSRSAMETIIRSPMLWREWDRWAEPRYLLARQTTRHLGELTEAREQLWYSYDASDPADCERVLAELATDVETYAMPWLARGWLWRLPDKDLARKEQHKAHHARLRKQLA